MLGFATNQLIELIDDTLELGGLPGTLATIAQPPSDDELTIAGGGSVDRNDFPRNPRIRRWDNPTAGAITVAAGADDGFLDLEDGVEVRFEAGHYNTGDYWLIPARTATRDVDWPRDANDDALSRPPDGIAHHYARSRSSRRPAAWQPCSRLSDAFPSLTTITADDVAFDNEACAIPGAETVQDALEALCDSSTLRFHKKHLHGWGIVCGLRVHCGPDEDEARRRTVSVGSGYAIDCDGNDVQVKESSRSTCSARWRSTTSRSTVQATCRCS